MQQGGESENNRKHPKRSGASSVGGALTGEFHIGF